MNSDTLLIGNRRYSSWSLRGWLMVRLSGLTPDVTVIPLNGTGQTPEVKRVAPAGLLPVLHHGGTTIWDTLAIAEYCAEIEPALWPRAPDARARARSIAAEMHSGFRALRSTFPMNLAADRPELGKTLGVRADVVADIARIQAIWADTRECFADGGPYLFGTTFNAADAMYAPVVCRFLSYHPALSAGSRAYCDAVRAHPLVREWYDAAAAEPPEWRVAVYEDLG